jgi:hypothetical protein
MKAIKYEKDAVLIKDGDIEAWVDVWVQDDDIRTEWNKYIFFTWDSKDVAQSAWQDNCDNFMEATSLAVQTLEEEGFIYQDESGKWYTNYIKVIEYADLSIHKTLYFEHKGDVICLHSDEQGEIGWFKVWYDSEEDGREYITVNNNITYLDTLQEL